MSSSFELCGCFRICNSAPEQHETITQENGPCCQSCRSSSRLLTQQSSHYQRPRALRHLVHLEHLVHPEHLDQRLRFNRLLDHVPVEEMDAALRVTRVAWIVRDHADRGAG